MRKVDRDDTIVAVSTPIGEGGIGIVRLSGPSALKIADEVFIPKDGIKPSRLKTHTTRYGHIVDKTSKGRKIDEVLLTVMRAPKSYTREDIVEINCHGGIQAVKMVLELVAKRGARVAQPGEFTKRAFLNGRIDLAQAEAVLDVIRSKTEGSLKVAMSQLEGEFSKRVEKVRQDVIDIASQIEASIDFPEEELQLEDERRLAGRIKEVLRKIKDLLDTYDEGMVFKEGILAIICGKPNVGKSSLMNLLLKRDRVIVSPIPGTTRDTVEEIINLKGVPIRLVDTAGIGKARGLIEKESAARSKKYLALADIVLLMLDGSGRIGREDRDIIKLLAGKKMLVIINKNDLAGKISVDALRRLFKKDKIVKISVKERLNIDLLEKELLAMVWKGGFCQGEGLLLNNARHKELLDKAHASMLSVNKTFLNRQPPEITAVDLREAIHNLGLIVGRTVSDDVLDRIFEQFCIGK